MALHQSITLQFILLQLKSIFNVAADPSSLQFASSMDVAVDDLQLSPWIAPITGPAAAFFLVTMTASKPRDHGTGTTPLALFPLPCISFTVFFVALQCIDCDRVVVGAPYPFLLYFC